MGQSEGSQDNGVPGCGSLYRVTRSSVSQNAGSQGNRISGYGFRTSGDQKKKAGPALCPK
jgi:hypothetical protein